MAESTSQGTPQPWADGPFSLCPVPDVNPHAHPAYEIAHGMVGLHNVFLRNINSAYRQAPNVKEQKDVQDLAMFLIFWCEALHGHHDAEEQIAFPGFEKVSNGEWKHIGDRNKEEHKLFNKSLEELLSYVNDIRAEKQLYDSGKLIQIIDKVMGVLHRHLQNEIETLVGLAKYEAKEIRQVYDEVNKAVEKQTNPYTLAPMMFGGHDTTWPESNSLFPQFPFFVRYMIHYIFMWKYSSVWKFLPCTTWGQPRPLHFL